MIRKIHGHIKYFHQLSEMSCLKSLSMKKENYQSLQNLQEHYRQTVATCYLQDLFYPLALGLFALPLTLSSGLVQSFVLSGGHAVPQFLSSLPSLERGYLLHCKGQTHLPFFVEQRVLGLGRLDLFLSVTLLCSIFRSFTRFFSMPSRNPCSLGVDLGL